jgi:hypothetical protein
MHFAPLGCSSVKYSGTGYPLDSGDPNLLMRSAEARLCEFRRRSDEWQMTIDPYTLRR